MWPRMVEPFSVFYVCHSVSTGEIKCVKQCSSMVGGKCSLIPLCNNCLNMRHLSVLCSCFEMQILGEALSEAEIIHASNTDIKFYSL